MKLDRRVVLIAVAVVLAVVAAIAVVVVTQSLSHKAEDRLAADRIDDKDAIVGAKTAMQSRMPDAQQISYDHVYVMWNDGAPTVCGDVDIVQDEDSFDGPERFIYASGDLMLEEADGTPQLDTAWKELCQR